MERGWTIVFVIGLAAQAQQPGLAGRGQVSVTVKTEDGGVLSGSRVYLRKMTAAGAPSRQPVRRTASTSVAGVVTFDLLPNGHYTLCIQAASGNWLNPCEWGGERPTVVVSAAQRTVSKTVVLKAGAAVGIHVDDPSLILARHERKTPGAHLLLGVRSDAGTFRLASVTARSTGGKVYSVTVPFDKRVDLVVASSFFRLQDASGVELMASGSTRLPVAVPSGQAPPTLRLAVSGTR